MSEKELNIANSDCASQSFACWLWVIHWGEQSSAHLCARVSARARGSTAKMCDSKRESEAERRRKKNHSKKTFIHFSSLQYIRPCPWSNLDVFSRSNITILSHSRLYVSTSYDDDWLLFASPCVLVCVLSSFFGLVVSSCFPRGTGGRA